MEQAHELEAVFRETLAALDRGDDQAAVASFAEDGVMIDYSEPTVVHRGRAAIAEVIRGFRAAFPDLRMELLDLVSGEDRLAAELKLRGTPAGGSEPVEVQGCVFYVFRDGEIVSEHAYMDSRQLAGEP